ncbi:Zinc finger protein NUTCRACKER [Platanthera zijinensis]|uniref:Protein EARLY HEADING DATE 2 n=1 Tax=Platanthera zijinensis TaxID=2320716 RepID=A0AAP0BI41_9ASPA
MSNPSRAEDRSSFDHMAVLGRSECDAGNPAVAKKRRNPPGNPDPSADVVALSPRTLLATNRYICEVCHKGFQRDQNLQLHRRGHNLPWKLKQRTSAEAKKRVYVCPETSCAHHDPSRALGDLTGIKKHFSRKHGEKKWKCDKCLKRYAVQSDWKAHSKICGTKEYRCDCGTIFSRKDSFITHRAFCNALHEQNFSTAHGLATMIGSIHSQEHDILTHSIQTLNSPVKDTRINTSFSDPIKNKPMMMPANSGALFDSENLTGVGMSMGSSFMSATALLQKAAEMGAKVSDESTSPTMLKSFAMPDIASNYGRCIESYSEARSEAGNGRFVPSTAGGWYGVTSSKRSGDGSRFRSAVDPFRKNGGESEIQDLNRRRDGGDDNGERRNGRMTQDFLGLGGNQSCNEDEAYSYHQMSNGPSAWGKYMWDY